MLEHWEHVEKVNSLDYERFAQHGIPLTTESNIPFNTAVYVENGEGSKRLEGIFDPECKAIRPLKCSNQPNRDLRLYEDAINNENINMIAVDGLPGTGKTSTVVHHVSKTLANTRVPMYGEKWKEDSSEATKVMISKPYINAGQEEYGFLPGSVDEKFDPTITNFIQYFHREIGRDKYDRLREREVVKILPLGFIRGLDANNMTLIIDEAQNTKELISVATRKAKGSRIFFLGDTSPFQIDRVGNTPMDNGLYKLIQLLRGAPYFQHIEMKSLEHIVRGQEVRDIMRRLFKQHGENPREWIV